jgi:poly-gamma-glutamate synthesis protein (capsule biosynthesis protein)
MFMKNSTLRYLFWVLIIPVMGFLIPFSSYSLSKFVYYGIKGSPDKTTEIVLVEEPEEVVLEETKEPEYIDGGNIDELVFEIPETGRAVKADLSSMTITLFEDGEEVNKFDILSIGKKGSPWETPQGQYKVLAKETKHFSSIGKVWMPYSVQFFGNFFVHGWPYYNSGASVSSGFSGGCIRLATKDSKEVFQFVEYNTPFFVTAEEDKGTDVLIKEPYYFLRNKRAFPNISAKAFLVADLDSGLIIKEKNKSESLPIASITKLITALVSLEAINQYSVASVSETAVSAYGTSGNLKTGEKLLVKYLLYPLLLSSSNDAAVALAEQIGERSFIKLMNEKSRSIGLLGTNFDDSSGLDPDNVSTAEDLFRLARYIFESKNYILQVTQNPVFKLEDSAGRILHSWYNNNKLSKKSDFAGGKNGYIPEAKETALAIFSLPLSEFSKRNIAIILLGSGNRERDVNAILSWLKSDVFYSEETILGDNFTRMFFIGDMMFSRGVENVVLKRAEGDFSYMLKNSDFIKNADIAFGNLEGPVSDKGEDLKNLYSFRFKPEVAGVLAESGFDVLSIANNHIGDWGREAFEDTLKNLNDHNILAVGGGTTKEGAASVKIIEKDGIKFGFLAFSDVGPNWMEAGDTESGILLANDKRFSSIVREASNKSDVLIVSFHFGEEYQSTYNRRQKLLAQRAIDSGAKIVIGHHPHVVQDVTTYRNGVIAYSLGNFIFDQNFSEETMRGLALEIVFDKDKVVSVKERSIKINSIFIPSLDE